ncbi:MAG: hypothetical protein KAI39_03815 [Desulfobulbaceae bacterium]|nr:hypothetical protein [Desulfobulbaceae bacterium]
MKPQLGSTYSPLFFLSALGNGGLSVGFYIFFMFLTPHPDTPIATFDTIWSYLADMPIYVGILSALTYVVILYFAYNHVRLLIWNIKEYRRYKKSDGYRKLIGGNNEITLMVIPLTLTMTINVMFVLGAMMVPGLWNIVEYLFPFAFLAFAATGIYSLTIFYRYYSKLLINGQFQHSTNNSLSQMISSFTFAMNAVGFAAPTAMSENRLIIPIAAFCTVFFFSVSALLAFKNLFLGFHAMLDKGISRDGSASIWILIPILTLLGITTIRLNHGLHILLHTHGSPIFNFIFCSTIVSLQIFIGILGFIIMRQNKYFPEFVHGFSNISNEDAAKSPASYALICPGVAFWVFGMFFLDKALVKPGLLTIFSLPHLALLLPMFLILIQTIRINWKLNKRLLYDTTL